MEFIGFSWTITEDRLIFTRSANKEEPPPPKDWKLENMYILFDEILRIFVDVKNEEFWLTINVISQRRTSKLPKYSPKSYTFHPASTVTRDMLDNLAQKLNFQVFGDPFPKPKRYKVIINPISGKGKAMEVFRKHVKPILQFAGCQVVAHDPNNPDLPVIHEVTHFVQTMAKGDAEMIARGVSLKCFDGIMCVGGDGTVHEVINGLANRPDGKNALKSLAIATIPAGSGNALSVSLFGLCHPSYAVWQAVKFKTMVVDLMSVEPLDKIRKPIWTFLSVAFGWIAHADINTEAWRFVGDKRFDVGILWQMVWDKGYKCSIATTGHLIDVDPTRPEKERLDITKTGIHDHYNREYADSLVPKRTSRGKEVANGNLANLIGTQRPIDKWEHTAYDNLYSFYAGKLPWTARSALAFPAALANDGYIDLCLLYGKVGLSSKVDIMKGFAEGKHFHHDNIAYKKVRAFKLIPGVDHQGYDYEDLHPNSEMDSVQVGTAEYPVPKKRNDVEDDRFKKDFILSIDGERFDPGHGIICEVHQGLATFVADSKLQKYQPTRLLNTAAKPKSKDDGSKLQKNKSNPQEDNSASQRGSSSSQPSATASSDAERRRAEWSEDVSIRLREYQERQATGDVRASGDDGEDDDIYNSEIRLALQESSVSQGYRGPSAGRAC